LIDTHCHLLAGIDDGAASRSESIEMARKLSEHGVSHVVCTPHFSTRYATDQRAAVDELVRLERVLDELDVPLRLVLAAEVSPAMAVRAPLEEIQRRAIGRRFVIVELLRDTTRAEVDTIVDRLDSGDLLPVFAHPERCRAVQTDPGVLTDARATGALLQIVAPSLTGDARSEVGGTAWELIARGDVDLVATDAHHRDSSGLRLDAILEVIARRFDETTARRLLVKTPRRLLKTAGVAAG
jgi:protein-tyrosine phosphatase